MEGAVPGGELSGVATATGLRGDILGAVELAGQQLVLDDPAALRGAVTGQFGGLEYRGPGRRILERPAGDHGPDSDQEYRGHAIQGRAAQAAGQWPDGHGGHNCQEQQLYREDHQLPRVVHQSHGLP